MSSFKDGDVEHVAVMLFGGPLDGERYRLPRVPPHGSVPRAVSLPLKQPASSSPFALYCRQGDEQIGSHYVFVFDDFLGPNGERVLLAPTFESSSLPNPVAP